MQLHKEAYERIRKKHNTKEAQIQKKHNTKEAQFVLYLYEKRTISIKKMVNKYLIKE